MSVTRMLQSRFIFVSDKKIFNTNDTDNDILKRKLNAVICTDFIDYNA